LIAEGPRDYLIDNAMDRELRTLGQDFEPVGRPLLPPLLPPPASAPHPRVPCPMRPRVIHGITVAIFLETYGPSCGSISSAAAEGLHRLIREPAINRPAARHSPVVFKYLANKRIQVSAPRR